MLRQYWLGRYEAQTRAGAEDAPGAGPVRQLLYLCSLASMPLRSGCIYGLLAIGYTLVYGIIGRINLAFGEIAMVGAYATFLGVADPGSARCDRAAAGPAAGAARRRGVRCCTWPRDRARGVPAAPPCALAGAADRHDRPRDPAPGVSAPDPGCRRALDPAGALGGAHAGRGRRLRRRAQHHADPDPAAGGVPVRRALAAHAALALRPRRARLRRRRPHGGDVRRRRRSHDRADLRRSAPPMPGSPASSSWCAMAGSASTTASFWASRR